MYMFYLYLRQLVYFAHLKSEKLEENLMKLSFWNKCMIVIAFMIGVLAFFTTLIKTLYLIVFYSIDKSYPWFEQMYYVYNLDVKVVWPLIDLIMAIALLYLFYNFG